MECGPEHGRYHVGMPTRGWRTNRCLWDWASTPFALSVMEAYAWFKAEGGGFLAWAGPDPAAVLLEAVMFYAQEVGACDAAERERQREERERHRRKGGPSAD